MHLASSLTAIHSLAVWACAMSPGPQTIDADAGVLKQSGFGRI